MVIQQAKTVIIEAFGGSEVLKIVNKEVGEPGFGELRVRHKACGLHFIDVYQRTGMYPLTTPVALGMES